MPQENPNNALPSPQNPQGINFQQPIQPQPQIAKPQQIKSPAQLAQKLPFQRIYFKSITQGMLISCQYMFWKHDPYPLVLVTDVSNESIRGVNLHYLTLPYIRDILKRYCDAKTFSYQNIKPDRFIVNAFRTYKKEGLREIKRMNCETIMQSMKIVRTVKPSEAKMIREEIQRQLQRQVNPRAEELSQQYQKQVSPNFNQGFQQLPKDLRPYGTQKPTWGAPIAPPVIPTRNIDPNPGMNLNQ